MFGNLFKRKKPEEISPFSTSTTSGGFSANKLQPITQNRQVINQMTQSPYAIQNTQPVKTTPTAFASSNLNQKPVQQNPVSYLSNAPTPKTQPFQPTQTTNQNTALDKLFATQQGFQTQNLEKNKQLIGDYYDKVNEIKRGQIAPAEQYFSTFKGNTEASIADEKARGEEQKQMTEENWGEGQRQAAQTRLESEGRIQSQYANAGSGDSYGYGSVRQATQDLETDFNRYTQSGLKEKERNFNEIDRSVSEFERTAKAQIQEAEMVKDQTIQAILNDISLSEIEKETLINQAEQETNNAIMNLQMQYEGLVYERNQAQSALQEDYQLLQQLSPEFKATGQPQTDQDMLYIQKYPDVYKQLLEGIKQGGEGSGASQTKQQAVALIDQLLGSNTGGITGAAQWGSGFLGRTLGSGSQLSANTYDQLKSLLSLENIQKLKGTGAISDRESMMLQQASTKLGRNLSDTDFRQVLSDLRNELSGGGYGTGNRESQFASLLQGGY